MSDNVFPQADERVPVAAEDRKSPTHLWTDEARPGLTKRELFAALIMPKLLALQKRFVDEAAEEAVRAADALIEALEATKP